MKDKFSLGGFKRSALRKMSKAKAKEYRHYPGLRMMFLMDKYCEFPSGTPCCINRATEIHHLRGRSGKMLNEMKYWMPICQEHHRWIHDNAKAARALGLLPK